MELNSKIVHGCIVKMAPGYHTKKPYYVEILRASKDEVITNIPGHHKLSITRNGGAWEYHLKRMTYIGSKVDHGKLLSNQKLD